MQEPSAAQVSFAVDLGIVVEEGISKRELARLIEQAKQARDRDRQPKLKLVHGTSAAASPPPAAAPAHRASPAKRVADRDQAFFDAMETYFTMQMHRYGRPVRDALLRTLAFFDAHELLRHGYPASIVDAIEETGWGTSSETVWGLLEDGAL